MFCQVFPTVMVRLLTTMDMQLLVIALTCTLHVLETLHRADKDKESRAVIVLMLISCDCEFYDVISNHTTNWASAESRDLSVEILSIMDRVNTMYGE